MLIKQISVFMQNKKGCVAEFCRLLGSRGIDMAATTIADTSSYGILRAVVKDTPAVLKLLREEGYEVSSCDVLAILVDDRAGGLAAVLTALDDAGVAVEYLYSAVRHVEGHSVVILRVDDAARAQSACEASCLRTLSAGELLPE